jgi:hypothetical protein
VKTSGESVIRINVDVERAKLLPIHKFDSLHYLIDRLLTGQNVADTAFDWYADYGISVDVELAHHVPESGSPSD